MDVNDILSSLDEFFKSSKGSVIRETSLAVSSVEPVAGVIATSINSFYQNYNSFKIECLLKGLSKGNNREKCLYELNNFICSSKERAYMVGNIFRETLAAESPRVSELYGIILSKHIGSKSSNFTHEELIVCKAIENANDYDLDIFKDIMTNSVLDNHEGKLVWLPEDKQQKYDLTCQWCVYNRLFWDVGEVWRTGSSPLPINTVETNYKIDSAATVLIEYINELGTTWDMCDSN